MFKKYSLPILVMLEILFIYIATKGLLIDGVFAWNLKQSKVHSMLIEIFLLFIILSAILIFVRKPMTKLLATVIPIIIFCWLHMIFVPVIVAALYIIYISAIGKVLRKQVFKIRTFINFETEFLLGCGALITLYCLMSVFKIGTIRNIQVFVLLSSAALCIYLLPPMIRKKQKTYDKIKHACRLTVPEAIFVAGIITFILIQAGKMNIAIDFDSYWYGLRSQYILENGKGIYENLGTVGLVYTYSKGLEVLTLPLANLPSHSFLIAFNFVLLILFLHICYTIVTLMVSKSYGLMICLWLASIPGIMNMSITTKTDILTLVFQVLLLLYMIYYLLEEEVVYSILSLSALLLTWALKPTSMIFSTAIFGMSGIYLIATKRLQLKASLNHWMAAVLSFSALIGIWARTVLIVGVPVTSIFTGIFTKIGFRIKYPFNVKSITNESDKEPLIYLVKRFYGIFLNPSDERMDHVIIAWGTILIPYAILLIVVGYFLKKSISKTTADLKRYLYVVFIPFTIVNVISMIMLYRPDGNYFILFYTMTLMIAGLSVYHFKFPKFRTKIKLMLIPLLIFNVIFSSLSNWSWNRGFSEIKVFHSGYYNHKKAEHQKMVDTGNEKIWEILAENPRTRVIAMGYHTDVLVFPCNIQSYYDIWNWGNEDIILSDTAFKKYMEYAKTDYIYVQGGFVDDNSKYSWMLSNLLKDGTLTDLVLEQGNLLAKVDLSGSDRENGKANYEEFYKNYNFYIESNGQE